MRAVGALLLTVGLHAGVAAAEPPRDAAAPAPAAPTAATAEPAAAPADEGAASPPSLSVFELSQIDRETPVSIEAETLEATDDDGDRTLTFRKDVRVRQGDLVLRTGLLEAVYPAGAKQPSRLHARDGVLVRQGDREARCDRADYDGDTRKIICTGDAVLKAGGDELRGARIVFDLAERRVSVEGGTQVAVAPRGQGGGRVPTGLEGLAQDGAITIEANQLDVWETPEGRRVVFDGSVRVAQEDLGLSARQIEALYPPGADQPTRVVARGDVVVTQGDREARCDEAEYRREERHLLCRGSAWLRRGDDRVQGEQIDFDLAEERVMVSGGATLQYAPVPPGAPGGEG